MFSEDIDVARIMREIKSSVIPEEKAAMMEIGGEWTERFQAYDEELNNIASFIDNTNEEIASNPVEWNLPSYERFIWPLRSLFRLISRVVRKSIKNLILHQGDINLKTSAVDNALKERQNIILARQNILMQEMADLYQHLTDSEKRNEDITDRIDDLNTVIKELEIRTGKLEKGTPDESID